VLYFDHWFRLLQVTSGYPKFLLKSSGDCYYCSDLISNFVRNITEDDMHTQLHNVCKAGWIKQTEKENNMLPNPRFLKKGLLSNFYESVLGTCRFFLTRRGKLLSRHDKICKLPLYGKLLRRHSNLLRCHCKILSCRGKLPSRQGKILYVAVARYLL
jgi:hypothetical protein